MALRAGHKVTVDDFDALGIVKRKTADETVASSTTLQDDDELFLPVVANGIYIVRCVIQYLGAGDGATGGLKLGWSGPTGATMRWCTNGAVQNSSLVTDIVVQDLAGGGRNNATSTTAVAVFCYPTGLLKVGNTSGNLQLRWAQGGSSVTGTTIKADSVLHATRIG